MKAIESWKDADATGLNLGLVYENRARIAIILNDSDVFDIYSKRCAEEYLGKHNPALAAKYDKLIQEARKAGIDPRPLEQNNDRE